MNKSVRRTQVAFIAKPPFNFSFQFQQSFQKFLRRYFPNLWCLKDSAFPQQANSQQEDQDVTSAATFSRFRKSFKIRFVEILWTNIWQKSRRIYLVSSVLQQRATTQIKQSNTSIKKTFVVLDERASTESAVSRKSSRQRRDSLKIIRLKKFKNLCEKGDSSRKNSVSWYSSMRNCINCTLLYFSSLQISLQYPKWNLFQNDQQGFCVWKRIIWKEKKCSTMKKSQSVTEESEEKKKVRPMCSVWFENKPN